jgi:hypothetical protein
MPTSWAPEVFVEGKWSRNALRFATKEEAEASAFNLMMRWTSVADSRATEADEPVNYRWVDGKGQISIEGETA